MEKNEIARKVTKNRMFLLSILLLFTTLCFADTVKKQMDGDLLHCIMLKFFNENNDQCNVMYNGVDFDRNGDTDFDRYDVDGAINEYMASDPQNVCTDDKMLGDRRIGEFCDGGDEDKCEQGTVYCNPSSGELSCIEKIFFKEKCDNNVDDDCDESINEGCVLGGDCPSNPNDSIYTVQCDGPDPDSCANGNWQCDTSTNRLKCIEDVHFTESCNNNEDDDCDDVVNEGCVVGGDCPSNPNDPIYTEKCDGPDSDSCSNGSWQCDNNLQKLVCIETVVDKKEICGNDIDDNCDGLIDENCDKAIDYNPAKEGSECDSSDKDLCYSGIWMKNGDKNELICIEDIHNVEDCHNTLDDDCDGIINNGCDEGERCVDSITGTACDGSDEDKCLTGHWECHTDTNTLFCEDDINIEEVGSDNIDNNCDGLINEGLDTGGDCVASLIGVKCDGSDSDKCFNGTWQCNTANTLICTNDLNSNEIIDDGIDNDCDGEIDEGGVKLEMEVVSNNAQEAVVNIIFQNVNPMQQPRMMDFNIRFDPNALSFGTLLEYWPVKRAEKNVYAKVTTSDDKKDSFLRITVINTNDRRISPGTLMGVVFKKKNDASITSNLWFKEKTVIESGENVTVFAPKEANDVMMHVDGNGWATSWGNQITVPGGVDDGLILHYPFNSLEANDISGKKRDGKLWGGRVVPGISGNAVYFDGIRDNVEIFNWNLKDINPVYKNEWTVSYWFYIEDNRGRIITQHYDTIGLPRLNFEIYEDLVDGPELYFYAQNELGKIADHEIGKIEPLKWYLLTYTVNETGVKIYLNDKSIDADPATPEVIDSFSHHIGNAPQFCPTVDGEYGDPLALNKRKEFILHSAKTSGNDDIYTMDKDGDFKENLTKSEKSDDIDADWSNTAGLIVFSSNRKSVDDDSEGEGYEIWTMKRDGTDLKQRTVGFNNAFGPKWNKSGTKIVFYSNTRSLDLTTEQEGDYEVFVLDLAHTKVTARNGALWASDFDPEMWAQYQITRDIYSDKNPLFVGENGIIYQSDSEGSVLLFYCEGDRTDPVDCGVMFPNTSSKMFSDKNPAIVDQNGKYSLVFDRAEINVSTGESEVGPFILEDVLDKPYVNADETHKAKPINLNLKDDYKTENFNWRPYSKFSTDRSLIFTFYKNNQPEIYRADLNPLNTGDIEYTVSSLRRISKGKMIDSGQSWEYYNITPVCHRAGGQSDKSMMFNGAIDEFRVWNYAVNQDHISFAYHEGETIMNQSWFKKPEKVTNYCEFGRNIDCAEYTVCETSIEYTAGDCNVDGDCSGGEKCFDHKCATACTSDENCDEDGGFCKKNNIWDENEIGVCEKRLCVVENGCETHDECGSDSFCIDDPYSDNTVCTSECSSAEDCFKYVCPMGGPCSTCFSGACVECTKNSDCPDGNQYHCDVEYECPGAVDEYKYYPSENKCCKLVDDTITVIEGGIEVDKAIKSKQCVDPIVPENIVGGTFSCLSECYDSKTFEFLCEDFHYCNAGSCKMLDFEMNDFLPATMKGLYTSAKHSIEIWAAGVSDYEVKPRMVFEVKAKESGDWIKIASWIVHNEICHQFPETPIEIESRKPVNLPPDATEEQKTQYAEDLEKYNILVKPYHEKQKEHNDCLDKIRNNTYKTSVNYDFVKARIRMDSTGVRDHIVESTTKDGTPQVYHNKGSLYAVGYPADLGKFDSGEPLGIKNGKKALFVMAAEFDYFGLGIDGSKTDLSKVIACNPMDDKVILKYEGGTLAEQRYLTKDSKGINVAFNSLNCEYQFNNSCDDFNPCLAGEVCNSSRICEKIACKENADCTGGFTCNIPNKVCEKVCDVTNPGSCPGGFYCSQGTLKCIKDDSDAGLYFDDIPIQILPELKEDDYQIYPYDAHADPLRPEREIRFQLLEINNITSF